jgi:hypothetical protein
MRKAEPTPMRKPFEVILTFMEEKRRSDRERSINAETVIVGQKPPKTGSLKTKYHSMKGTGRVNTS